MKNRFLMFRVAPAGPLMENFLKDLISTNMSLVAGGSFLSFSIYEFETDMDIHQVHDFFKSNQMINYIITKADESCFRAHVSKVVECQVDLNKYDLGIEGASISDLRKMLDDAIKSNSFELAAKIRDIIKIKSV